MIFSHLLTARTCIIAVRDSMVPTVIYMLLALRCHLM
jgi:hypothetical protein